MKRIINIFFFCLFACSLAAQSTITWKGGTPGKENSWNEPKNWDKQRVPTDLDKAIIRVENNGHYSMPVIDKSATAASVEIQSGASLNITESGELTIDGRNTYSEGIILRGGLLNSNGNVVLLGIDQDFDANSSNIKFYTSGNKRRSDNHTYRQVKAW